MEDVVRPGHFTRGSDQGPRPPGTNRRQISGRGRRKLSKPAYASGNSTRRDQEALTVGWTQGNEGEALVVGGVNHIEWDKRGTIIRLRWDEHSQLENTGSDPGFFSRGSVSQ